MHKDQIKFFRIVSSFSITPVKGAHEFQEGLPLLKEEVVEYFPLFLFGGGHRSQEREGFLLQGIYC